MPITTKSIYERVMKRLRDVPETSSQIYDEGPMLETIQYAFDSLFDKYWWFEYTELGATYALDATTGYPATAVDGLVRFTDIKTIWLNNDDDPLPLMPMTVNPANITRVCIQPLPYSSSPKVFRIIPITTDANITMVYRKRPDNFTALDDTTANTIYLDDQLMILKTAWDFINGNGLNPAEEEKIKGLFLDREQQLISNMRSIETAIGPASAGIMMNWSENGAGEY